VLTVYGDRESGNCYKVLLVLHLLGIGYRWRPVDILAGETRRPDFLARNPNGRVPVLELAPGVHLAESNAILCYLAEGSALMPDDRLLKARILQWLFFEQYSHEPNIATSRYYLHYLKDPVGKADELARRRAPGLQALAVMEDRLARLPFFVGERLTVADIALFAYTHVAGEGGFDLAPFPAIRSWIDRVREQPGFEPMRAE
jgi:glutathione S-transferase